MIPKNLWRNYPYILAIITIVFFGISLVWAFTTPYSGLYFDSTGLVDTKISTISNFNKASKIQVLSINGIPLNRIPFPFRNNEVGEKILFELQVGNSIERIFGTLIIPPVEIFIIRLLPMVVALFYWAISVGVIAFRTHDKSADLFFIFCQASMMILVTGSATLFGPIYVSNIFNVLLWFLGPIMLLFHIYFPKQQSINNSRNFILFLFCLPIIGSLPYLLWNRREIESVHWGGELQIASQILLAICLIGVVTTLINTYRTTTNTQVRGKIRIVILGGFLGLIPLLVLAILPNTLFGEQFVPVHFVSLVLIVIPLSYGYAIVRHRLIEIEKHVNRGATQVLVLSLVGGIYFLLTALFNNATPFTSIDPLIVDTVLVLFLASIFTPLRKKVQILVDQAFYGGWYDYRSAIVKITDGLEQITDLRLLAASLCQRSLNTLLLENIFLFLTGPKGDLSIYESYGKVDSVFQQAASFPILPPDSPLLLHLSNLGGPVDSASLKTSLATQSPLTEDVELLDCSFIRLWVPIYGREKISGILALGQKVGGDIFSVDDYYILGVVSRQVGPLIENIHLLTRLRQHAKDLELRVEERTAELHDAKERVEAILASVGDGVFVTDLDGSIITVNNAFENQLYYTYDEVFSTDFYSLFVEDNPPDVLADIRLTLREGDLWEGDLLSRRKDGSIFDVQLTIAPVRDQHGRMVGFVGSQRDITKQRELDRLKDQFISDVSHELRTPITNLSLYIGFLERATKEKSSEYLSIIKSETRRLTVLLEDILDLSRLARKNPDLIELNPVDLNEIIQQVVSANKLLAVTSGLNLEFQPGENIPPVLGDENLIARVITNLVSNAIRYTPGGAITAKSFLDDHKVCIQVKDTGIGIPSEDMPHIFDRFYRGRKVSQTKIHGTGLGLAIVKEIVDLHEGTIEVISEENRGTTVNIWFPLEEEKLWPVKLS